jgi:hypothetical protein
VKARAIAVQHLDSDVLATARGSLPRYQRYRTNRAKKMSRKILSLAGLYLLPCSQSGNDDGTVPVEDVRAVNTEAALATSLDASPAVLVSLWAQDERLHRGDRPRRGR